MTCLIIYKGGWNKKIMTINIKLLSELSLEQRAGFDTRLERLQILNAQDGNTVAVEMVDDEEKIVYRNARGEFISSESLGVLID